MLSGSWKVEEDPEGRRSLCRVERPQKGSTGGLARPLLCHATGHTGPPAALLFHRLLPGSYSIHCCYSFPQELQGDGDLVNLCDSSQPPEECLTE